MTARHAPEPAARRQRFDNLPPAQQAGMLSNDRLFQTFAGKCLALRDQSKIEARLNPSAAAEFIRRECKVASRSDLNTDPAAQRRFAQLRTEFDAWRGKIANQR